MCECIFKRHSDYTNLVLLVFLASPPLPEPLCIQRTTIRRILGAGVGAEQHTQWDPVLEVGTAYTEPEVALCRVSNLLGSGSH